MGLFNWGKKKEEPQAPTQNAAKAEYESFRKWCFAQNNGDRYYDEHDRIGPDKVSQYERILDRIKKCEYRLTIAPTILEKARESVLQSDLVKQFDTSPDEVRLIIRKLEEEGRIIREKSGKSYIIKAK